MTDTTPRTHAIGPAGVPADIDPRPLPQYSRRRILGTWAAAALPMAALAWIVAPWLAGTFEGPSAWPRAILLSLTVGMVWQFVFVVLSVRREQGSLRWSVVKDALWLRAPRSPRTGRRGGRLWWLLVPLVLAVAAKEAAAEDPGTRPPRPRPVPAVGRWPGVLLRELAMVRADRHDDDLQHRAR